MQGLMNRWIQSSQESCSVWAMNLLRWIQRCTRSCCSADSWLYASSQSTVPYIMQDSPVLRNLRGGAADNTIERGRERDAEIRRITKPDHQDGAVALGVRAC